MKWRKCDIKRRMLHSQKLKTFHLKFRKFSLVKPGFLSLNSCFLHEIQKYKKSNFSARNGLYLPTTYVKVTPHQIFRKRAIFEKIILFNLLLQTYTKITKKYQF